MKKHPLAEVFGFPADNLTPKAERYRRHKLCPYGNRVPNCTKDKADHPLGVCSIHDGDEIAITCPIRLRQEWIIAEDAARFFFPPGTKWTSLTEVRLNDRHGKSAGNIDLVLVAYDDEGRPLDFGGLMVQAAHISGNVRRLFDCYMEVPGPSGDLDWRAERLCPRADYVVSTRKLLAPRLTAVGGILHSWGKRVAVALDRDLYESLPRFEETHRDSAEMAWLVYDVQADAFGRRYQITRYKTVYTGFRSSVDMMLKPVPGDQEDFVNILQLLMDQSAV